MGLPMSLNSVSRRSWNEVLKQDGPLVLAGAYDALSTQLHEAGAKLIVADVVESNVKWAAETFGAKAVQPDEIYDVDADVFSPCSVGSILNDDTIKRLKVKLICGTENNQLAREHHSDEVTELGFVYIPDYVANAGGLASCDAEWYGHSSDLIESKVRGIYDTCRDILLEARSSNRTTTLVANAIAESRFSCSDKTDE